MDVVKPSAQHIFFDTTDYVIQGCDDDYCFDEEEDYFSHNDELVIPNEPIIKHLKMKEDDDIHKVIVPPRDFNPISHILSAPVCDDSYCTEHDLVEDFTNQRLCKSVQFDKQLGLDSSFDEFGSGDEDSYDNDDYFMFL
ncbi:hypothetical protein EDI_311740 [Entamoeba dispar SAW760]|uniref:Uncharacterized protein n=1 Tax=Entamoeba dispar (strain ATCC PRA-260 / SAW760) TaxID=370354 RepID=B0E9Z2_ENTDS|nr:uncharacterized protein EDI_311740 [Entamoeba dispar SAW760]EDR28641.1 hypothetical protein EDI_311740 [Entamoeba dispar SAW760]|eukprot:EDR28641.1 hypothetical protein EDI_311740 [Entamoeba dispar SAW760]